MSKMSGKQRQYLNSLVKQVGDGPAREAGRRVLNGEDIFREVATFPSAPWRRERRLDNLSRWEATHLINELQDIAGRKGRRRNNRRRTM